MFPTTCGSSPNPSGWRCSIAPLDTLPWPEVATTEGSPSVPTSPDQQVSPPSLRRSSRVSRVPDHYGVTISH